MLGDVGEGVDLAHVALGDGEIGPELGNGVDLVGQVIDPLGGGHRIESGGRSRGVEALQVQLGMALGSPVGEELAHEQPTGLGFHLVPVADVVAGVGGPG